jgi:hypothetical protein
MQPANVDPVECARLIVYAHAASAYAEPQAACSMSSESSTPTANLRQLAGISAQPFFPPNIPLTLLCVLLSVAIVAWSIAAP